MSNLPKKYELGKMTVRFADNREMSVGYDLLDYRHFSKNEQKYHIVWIYLDSHSASDAHIAYKVTEWEDGKFYAEFWASHYGQDADKVIKEILPEVIHGEKELRDVVKNLAKRREEILSLSV